MIKLASPVIPSAAAVVRLRAAGCIAPEDEARELLAAAPGDGVPEEWIARREQGEPLAWITGSTEFCGRRIHIAPGVYVPRVQTEELARRAAALLPPGGRAADLCTGSGAIAGHLQAEDPSASVVGVDVDPRAVACAGSNGVHAVLGDLDGALGPDHAFDLVTCVPPYVPTAELGHLPADVQRYESSLALDGGPDGLDVARRVVETASRLLTRGGSLVIELGGDQDRLLAPDLITARFEAAETWHDEEGDLRGLVAQLRSA